MAKRDRTDLLGLPQMVPGVIILPGDPSEACPELLTEEEAIRYLRINETCIKDPSSTLRYYRKKGWLRATQVGRRIRYRRLELERLLDRLTEENTR